MDTSKLTIGQKEALLKSLEDQKSPMTEAEKRTLQALKPRLRVIEVKRTRDVNTQCSFQKIIKTYKSCTLAITRHGITSFKELKKAETHITNRKIREASYGHIVIK